MARASSDSILIAAESLPGTERRLSAADTPKHNGVAGSLNRRLMERTRFFMKPVCWFAQNVQCLALLLSTSICAHP